MVSRVRVDGPGEFLAALPYLLGVWPQRQVVVTGGGHDGWLSRAVCVDSDQLAEGGAEVVISEISTVLARHGVRWVLIACIDDRHAHPETRDPVAELSVRMAGGCAAADISVVERVWAPTVRPGAVWRTATRRGTVPDASTSPLAVAQVVAGRVIYPNREAIVADLSPTEPDSVLTERAYQLATHPEPPPCPRRLIEQVITRARHGALPRTDKELTAVARALTTTHGQAAALAQTATAPHEVRDLWTHLVRTLPGMWRVEPGALAAIALVLVGQAAMAGVAVDLAAQAAPDHTLPRLLRHALSVGVSPAELIQLVLDASTAEED